MKKYVFFPLLALPLLVWLLLPVNQGRGDDFSAEKVNLALRRTADELLRQSGDSTSRIPAIEQFGVSIWRVKLEQHFEYDLLPALLQGSLDRFGIKRSYSVAVRRCEDATIDLGYQQIDVLNGQPAPCSGREMPEGCHFIEVTFTAPVQFSFKAIGISFALIALAMMLGVWAGYRMFQRKKKRPEELAEGWLAFGNSRLDAAGQVLLCNGKRETLTFREAKLLRLFAGKADQLLEREFILQEVWADEGVLVGRSIDMFISRLRKKLSADPSVTIVAVHGVGYRLEIDKN